MAKSGWRETSIESVADKLVENNRSLHPERVAQGLASAAYVARNNTLMRERIAARELDEREAQQPTGEVAGVEPGKSNELVRVTYTLPYPPAVNHMWLRGPNKTYLSKEARAFKSNVANMFTVRNVVPLTGEIAVTVRLYRPRKTGDLDGYLKSCFDALNGILWVDDKQIIAIHAYRFDDKLAPRVELEVMAL